uniref:Diacylglycerol O-acyltransferase n=1 Tax=Kalanchoe fedtschenkoi TaxID=63787 RepID=A0A7N0U9C8_KALFE
MVAVSGEYALEEPMSPAGRLFHTRGFNCFVIAVVGSSEVVDVDRVKIGLQQSLLKHPRFSSVMEGDDGKGGRRRWVRTAVNLDNHIVVPGIDPDMDSPDEFVEDYVSELTRSSMDTSIPLWELHLLKLKTKNANSIGIFKIHHSIGDGTSLMSLILASTRKISDPDALPSIPKAKKSGNGRGHRTGLGGVLFGIWWGLTLLWNTLVDMVLFVMTVLFLKDTDTPIKGKPGVEFNPKRIVYREFSLDDVKLVKNATKATINDVILGMTQAGVSQYLNRKYSADGEKADGASGNNLPENIRLRANVLVNIRQSAGIEDLAEMMERNSKVKWGNKIAYVLIPFKITIPEDPLDYVRQAKAIIDMKKHSLEAIATYRIGKLLLDLFGIKS